MPKRAIIQGDIHLQPITRSPNSKSCNFQKESIVKPISVPHPINSPNAATAFLNLLHKVRVLSDKE